MKRLTQPKQVTRAVFGLLLCIACAAAVAGEPHVPMPTAPTLFYACMSTGEAHGVRQRGVRKEKPGARLQRS